MNVSKVQAEVMASADHSKVEQLNQVVNKLVSVVNNNSYYLRELISAVQQPVNIDGHDLLRVMREESNTTTNRLISKEVIKYINQVKGSITADKNMISKDKDEVKHSHNTMKNILNKFAHGSLVVLAGVVLASVMPWWPLKVIIGIVSIVGGYIYGMD